MSRKVTALVVGMAAVIAALAVVAFGRGATEAAEMPNDGLAAAMAQPALAPIAPATGERAAPTQFSAGGQRGIWVSGAGRIAVEPDIAMLSLGVQSTAPTVAEANGDAAVAMDAVLATLRANDVADKDIQTRNFSIYPQYDYREQTIDGVRTSGQVLTGYQVSNDVSAKIRSIDDVGDIIDAVVAAAGDNVRVNNIRFTLEDPSALRPRLREMAVRDALSKAERLAELSGVNLGRLVYISESFAGPSAGAFGGASYERFALADAAALAPPISGGETEVTFSVSAGFSIY